VGISLNKLFLTVLPHTSRSICLLRIYSISVPIQGSGGHRQTPLNAAFDNKTLRGAATVRRAVDELGCDLAMIENGLVSERQRALVNDDGLLKGGRR
jgi:hypothetical protein